MNNKNNSSDLLSISTASEILGVSLSTLRRWDQSGSLKSIRINGGIRRYRREDIKNLIQRPKVRLKDRAHYSQPTKTFPPYRVHQNIVEKRLTEAYKANITYKDSTILGYPGSTPLKQALSAYVKFLDLNANNIGTHTRIQSESGFRGTQQLERDSIAMLASLFGADNVNNQVDGYLTSGGTEGNIMGLWILRNLSEIQFSQDSLLLKTGLTHYSFSKAFNLLRLNKIEDVMLDTDLAMDVEHLEEKIRKYSSGGQKVFIVICTLGYTVTGSIDKLSRIQALIDQLEKQIDIKVLIHIDSAQGGFIYPFLSPEYTYGFNFRSVMTISLDAHKSGLLPYSCGIFLCRKNLQQYVETDVPYIRSHFDDTLIGSRNGAVAASLWAAIMSNGREGYRSIYRKCLKTKTSFIHRFKKAIPKSWSYTNELMNIVAIEIPGIKGGKLSNNCEKKFGLNLSRIVLNDVTRNVYKIVFMPHVSETVISEFLKDITHANS